MLEKTVTTKSEEVWRVFSMILLAIASAYFYRIGWYQGNTAGIHEARCAYEPEGRGCNG